MDVCTIVARNYLPYARVLVRSLTAVHPDARATVLIVDGEPDPADASLFHSLRLDDVLPDDAERRRQAFMYDVTELSTAVKPLLLAKLLAAGAPSVLYFDPDIQIFDSIEFLSDLARERHMVLTPHTLAPIPDDGFDITDLAVLRAGVFNLGFIGVGPGSEPFLDWWRGRLRRYCISEPASGTFVDQRWVDYVPASFPHVVVRDPGCNVAYWNLHERRVTRTTKEFLVNGGPLRFYHFSGFDANVPYLLSKHQGVNPRVLLSDQPVIRELCDAYAEQLRASGYTRVAEPYGFATLSAELPIDPIMRRVYRQALLAAEREGLPPPPASFQSDEMVAWFNEPSQEAPKLSRYLLGLYQARPDIQRTFPRPLGQDADAYLHWAAFDRWARVRIPAAFRPPGSAGSPAGTEDLPLPAGLNISGYFKVEQGVGEVARTVATAARSAGIPVATIGNSRTLGRQQDAFELDATGGPYDTTLVCANADELPRAMDALPRAMVARSHRIGFWFWETEQLPGVYAPSADLVDEIWVASEYVAAAVRATVSKPVFICPVPLRRPDPLERSRAELGLPEGFLFLFMFDFLSNIQRKNPIGLIEAFCRAFRPGEGPTLVLKSINAHLARRSAEAVRAAIAGRPDIIAMENYLAARERDALVTACDCYVSLHRSEGLGLTLAEAMAVGKPLVATAYSGNMAFMTPENSFLVPWQRGTVPAGCEPYPEGDAWAEPDLAAAADCMRLVYSNPETADERGRRGREHVLAQLSMERTVVFVRERLADIGAQREAERRAAEVEAAAEEPPPPPLEEAVNALLEDASRDAGEADQKLEQGIPFDTPSPFGWPGRLLRTAILRILRPYSTYSAGVQRQHLRSTVTLLESIRLLQGRVTGLQNTQPGKETARLRK